MYIIKDIPIINNELYFITILFIYCDNNTNIIYVIKNHQAPLYAGFIAVNININVLNLLDIYHLVPL